jgi:hypothetical protein
MIKLTFDTNVLRDYLEARRMDHSHAVALVRLEHIPIAWNRRL